MDSAVRRSVSARLGASSKLGANDGLEQRLLAGKPMIEGALRDAGALGDGLDAGHAEAAAEKQPRCNIEDAVGELRRLQAGRPAAMTANAEPCCCFRCRRHH